MVRAGWRGPGRSPSLCSWTPSLHLHLSTSPLVTPRSPADHPVRRTGRGPDRVVRDTADILRQRRLPDLQNFYELLTMTVFDVVPTHPHRHGRPHGCETQAERFLARTPTDKKGCKVFPLRSASFLSYGDIEYALRSHADITSASGWRTPLRMSEEAPCPPSRVATP